MLDDSGVQEVVRVVDTVDLPATTGLKVDLDITKDKDFNVNYIVLDYLFQGATDEPTEAEKLAKLNTFNIVTKGSGKWGTDINFADMYYRYLARLRHGQPSFLIGDGGGDDDYHGMRIILDAGGGLKINNSLAWTPELEATLKFNYLADAGLDNSKLRYEIVGYKGSAPRGVLALENAEPTLAVGGLEKFSVSESERLQEFFAFLTTELNLATIQTVDTFGIKNLQVRPNDQENQKKILAYVNQMVDGINDGGEGLIQQYARKSFDLDFQGFGYPLHNNDKVAVEGGVAEAGRLYLSKLQPIVTVI